MFEANMTQVPVFRKIIDSLKELVTEVNLEATTSGKQNIHKILMNNNRTCSSGNGFCTCIFSFLKIK